MPGAATRNAETGAAAGQRETRDRIWRDAIVGADGGAGDTAGRAVGAERGIAVGGLRAAIARRPYAPALLKGRRRRLGEHRIGVACGVASLSGGIPSWHARACSRPI